MNIDNRFEEDLRKSEAEHAPDLSHMEAHWQQMQMLLQGPATPASPGMFQRFWWLIPVALLLLGGGWWLVQKNNSQAIVIVPTLQQTEKQPNQPALLLADTVEAPHSFSSASANDGHKMAPYLTDDDVMLSGMKLRLKPCDICPDTTHKRQDSVATIFPPRQMLDKLLDSIKQLAQQFTISPQRDTLLVGANGTGLFIPAGSFSGNGQVKIQLREYYSTSAMLAEGLTTQSNGRSIISGGMIEVQAFQNEQPVALVSNKSVYWFLPDTAATNQSMHLFKGDATGLSAQSVKEATAKLPAVHDSANINVKPSGRSDVNWQSGSADFQQMLLRKEVYVQNLINQPYTIKQTRTGEIATFIVGDELKTDQTVLKRILKEKYGYRKVKLRTYGKRLFWYSNKNQVFNTEYAEHIGDSMWMRADYAQQYQLDQTATRWVSQNYSTAGAWLLPGQEVATNLAEELNHHYYVRLNELGRVNSGAFTNFSGDKTQLRLALPEDAQYYFTCLVFDRYKCLVQGKQDGNEVLFNAVPLGEKVKIISVGINAKGEAVYATQEFLVGKDSINELKFSTTHALELQHTLSK